MAPGRRLPEWLIGLILAIVLVVAGFFLLDALGAGDDPSFEGSGAAPATSASRAFLGSA